MWKKGLVLAASRAQVFAEAEIVLQVRTPGAGGESGQEDLSLLKQDQTLIGFSEPLAEPAVALKVAERHVTVFFHGTDPEDHPRSKHGCSFINGNHRWL